MASKDENDSNQLATGRYSVDDTDDSHLRPVKETISLDETENNERLIVLSSEIVEDSLDSTSESGDVTEDNDSKSHVEGIELDEASVQAWKIEEHITEIRDSEKPTEKMASDNKITALLTSLRDEMIKSHELELAGNDFQSRIISVLLHSSAKLNAENSALKKKLEAAQAALDLEKISSTLGTDISSAGVSDDSKEYIMEELHLVWCATNKANYFKDVPRMFKGDRKFDHLRGHIGIDDVNEYIKFRPYTVAAVVNITHCWCQGGPESYKVTGYNDGVLTKDSSPGKVSLKDIYLTPSTTSSLQKMMAAKPELFIKGFSPNPSHWRLIYEPYLPFYLHSKTFLDHMESCGLEESECKQIKLLCNWFEKNCRKDWDEADELLSRGKITAKHYSKLFRPKELVVNRRPEEKGLMWIYQCGEYPWASRYNDSVNLSSWEFNGSFQKVHEDCRISSGTNTYADITERDGEKDITSLKRYPLRFADSSLHARLIARGHKFWRCRKSKLVSYVETEREGNIFEQHNQPPLEQDIFANISRRERRFIVDYDILRRLHPSKPIFQNRDDDLGSEAMEKDEPPDDTFLAMLPPLIHAYDLESKAWKLIQVDRITDVMWNKDAFKRLVAPAETKEMIEAAVTAHGHQLSVAPDIIAGKGQGLLILLHGGPGTGKTLTAESIAEMQERPLYRVTCGDIGIHPTDVETYLQSVLIIGKAWGCVVLLDEADVFLEERSMLDQEQNAVVSVFLRVLEYYDGILILTTNRVGTFDEAFKSRIHLALPYSDLDEDQRVEIWRNFIDMLKHAKERIDVQDLQMNVNKLAQIKINGRQIRNVLTLARYLATHRKQMLVYKHVQDAVATVRNFDEYLVKLRGSDEKWARESRLR